MNNKISVENNLSVINNRVAFKANLSSAKIGAPLRDLPKYMDSSQAIKNIILGGLAAVTGGIAAKTITNQNNIQETKEIDTKPQIETKQIENVLDDLDIKYEKNPETGLYTIDNFVVKNEKLFNTLLKYNNLTSDQLFQYIENIKNDAIFRDSNVTNLGNLKTIGGMADFTGSSVIDLGNLEYIGGSALFYDSEITSLKNIKKIDGSLILSYLDTWSFGSHFYSSKLNDLGNLEYIGDYANFERSEITSLKNLKRIDGSLNCARSQLVDLGDLEYVYSNVDLSHTKIKDLNKLEYIGNCADFRFSEICDLKNLKTVGNRAVFEGSQITSYGNLEIGHDTHNEYKKMLGISPNVKATDDVIEKAYKDKCLEYTEIGKPIDDLAYARLSLVNDKGSNGYDKY